jgi:hypothetical protein
VSEPALSSITVAPSTVTVYQGTAIQFTATGKYADGSSIDVTNTVTWKSSYTTIAAVSATGMVQSVGLGSTTISVTLQSITGISTVTVVPPFVWQAPAPITYGTALNAAQLNAKSGVSGTYAYAPPAGTVLQAGTHPLNVAFTPADKALTHLAAKATVKLTVAQAKPTVIWVTPLPVAYGTALSATQLNANAKVAGTFTYSPVKGSILTAGSHTLSVTFKPSDATDYISATQTVKIQVNQAKPMLALVCPEVAYDGKAHTCSGSATGSNRTPVSGAWTFSPANGTRAGSYVTTGTFKSSDTNYSGGIASGTLKIDPTKPTITWPAPAAITYGTALSATQLNANAKIAGAFTYSPAAGAILALGSHTLSVTFKPTDATDYTSATQSVKIQVN